MVVTMEFSKVVHSVLIILIVANGSTCLPDFLKRGLNALKSTTHCLLDVNKSFNDTYLGQVDLDASTYCSPKCQRSLLTCCLPQTPTDLGIKFQFYPANAAPEAPPQTMTWTQVNTEPSPIKSQLVVIQLHGFLADVDHTEWMNRTRLVYQKSGADVILVDW